MATKKIVYKDVVITVSIAKEALPGVEAEAEAPEGKVFFASDTHFVYGYDFENDQAAVKRAIAPIKLDIDGGFEDCTNEECEICNPEE